MKKRHFRSDLKQLHQVSVAVPKGKDEVVAHSERDHVAEEEEEALI